jgi:uncharacterized oligopeptide transporter (OPT) family protein
MTAAVTGGASIHAADLLVDIKAGYLLGANPRRQFIAQFFGIFMGTLACVPVYNLIVDPTKLGSDQMPAPAAQVWASVAKLLKDGVGALPASAIYAALIGAFIGALIPVVSRFAPATRRYLPSPTALGIAFVVPGFSSIAMFIGAFAAWLLEKYKPRLHERYTIAVSSGVIAGESLMGILVALLTVFHVLG